MWCYGCQYWLVDRSSVLVDNIFGFYGHLALKQVRQLWTKVWTNDGRHFHDPLLVQFLSLILVELIAFAIGSGNQ